MGNLTIAKLQRGYKPTQRGGVKFLCPACGERKIPREFRQSNRNPKRSTICCQCRQTKHKVEQTILSVKTRKQMRAARRKNSPFRQRFLTVCSAVYGKKLRKEQEWLKAKMDTLKIVKFPERVAAIVAKTFAVRGDDYSLSDDEALVRIKDLLEELDPEIIARNKNKRLSTK